MLRRLSIFAVAALGCGGIGAAADRAPAEYDLRVVRHQVPTSLEAGAVVPVRVTVANDGTRNWSPSDGFALSYHWLDSDLRPLQWDGRRTPLGAAVGPGQSREVVAELEAPRAAGDYLLALDIVHEGVLWVSERDPTPVEPLPVSVVAGHAFAVVAGAVPRLAVGGAELRVRLVLENRGARGWRDDGSFALASHWLGRDGAVLQWEGPRSPIPRPVAPGETIELTAVVEVPVRPGVRRLQWDMVEEGVCWFSERSAAPPPVRTVIVVPDLLADPLWWALLSLLAAVTAVSVLAHGGPRRLLPCFAVADVAWCVGALVVKQGAVLAAAEAPARLGGLVLTAGGAALVGLAVLALPGRWRAVAGWAAAACATAVLWGDLVYLRFFGDLPAPGALAAAAQVRHLGESIRSLFEPADAWLWIDLLPGLVLVAVSQRLRRTPRPGATRAAVVVLVLAVVAAGAAALRLASEQPRLFEQIFRRVHVAREVGVLNLHAVELGTAAVRAAASERLETGDLDEAVEWFAERAPLRAGTGPWFGAASGRSLVMVQVESLQGFVIGLEIGGREVTPFLNRWAEEALWFDNVTDQTAQGRSSDSELATQVSLLPADGAAGAFRFAGNDFTGLAEVLARHGYRTLSAVPYDGAFWNRRATHPAYGYARSLFAGDFAAGEQVGWGLSDRDFLDQAAAQLASTERPFAAFLLTLSLHHPFEGFPQRLAVLDLGEMEGTPFGNFLHTMHFFDSSLAAFVASLEAAGRSDEVVIAVWGDHDAGFPWRPEIAAAMGADHDPAGWYLSQEVPLLIRVPGVDGLAGRRSVPAGHADVAPTLLALLGIDPAPYAFLGRNLLGAPGAEPVLGEYGCWRDDRLLFLQGDGSLAGGTCIELEGMRRVPAGRCRDGFAAARRAGEVSALVLEHDLQERIHDELARRAGSDP